MSRVIDVVVVLLGLAGLLEAATPIAAVTSRTVSFETEILPILQANCLPCHNRNTTKADLNLETPAAMLKGGDSGPALVPKRAERSLLLRVAAHAVEPFMPPKGNKANAVNLTPEELGLIRLWINQGARTGASAERTVEWQPVAPSFQGVGAVALSPDGRFLACGRANRLMVYDLATQVQRNCELEAKPNRDLIGSVAFSPDGMFLASGGYREVQLWRLVPRSARVRAQSRGARSAVVKMPEKADNILDTNGLRVMVEGTNRVRIVRMHDGETVRTLDPGGVVAAAKMTPDGRRLLTLGAEGAGILWNVADGKRVADLGGTPQERWRWLELEDALALARADRIHFTNVLARVSTNLVLAVEREKKAGEALEKASKALEEKTLAQAKAREALAEAEKVIAGFVEPGRLYVAFDTAQAAVSQAAAKVKSAEDRKDGAALPALKAELEMARAAETLAKTALENLATADREAFLKARARVQETRKPIEEATQQLATAERVRGTAAHELDLAAKARGNAEGAVADAEASLVSTTTRESVVEAQIEALRNSKQSHKEVAPRPGAAAFDDSGRIVVLGGADGSLSAWDTTDGFPIDGSRSRGKSVEKLEVSGGVVRAFAAGGRHLEWDMVPDWEWVGSFGDGSPRSPITDRAAALAFSPDGRFLATGGGQPTRGGEIVIWDVAKRRVTQTLTNTHSDQVFSLAWSPDGRHLASGGADRFARVVEVATGKVAKNFEGHTHYVLAVAWRRDGRVLASAGAEGVVKTWDFASGDRLKNLTGQDKEVTALGFLGIRGDLVAVSGDPRVRVFKEDGTELRVFEPGGEFLAAGAVDRRGRRFAAGGPDGVIRVWEMGQAAPWAVLPPVSLGQPSAASPPKP